MRIYLKGLRIYATIPRIKDANKLAKNDTETNKELGIDVALDKISAEEFIKTAIVNFNNMKEFHFGIYTKNHKFIGLFSIIQPNYSKRICEIGYWIAKKYREKKYGEDAIKIITDFAFKTLKMKKIFAFVNTNNKASIRLLKSAQFKKTHTSLKSATAFEKTGTHISTYVLHLAIYSDTKV